jgi:hypothetical protein
MFDLYSNGLSLGGNSLTRQYHTGKNGWPGNVAGSYVVTLNGGSKLAVICAGKHASGKRLAFAVPTSHDQFVS